MAITQALELLNEMHVHELAFACKNVRVDGLPLCILKSFWDAARNMQITVF